MFKTKRSRAMYDPYTFVFNNPTIQVEFDEYLGQKPIDPGVLRGQLIYNVLACPYFIGYHYHYHIIMKRPYESASLIFFLTVMLIHICFFTFYALEPNDSPTLDEKQKKLNGKRRMLVIDIFMIASSCACGIVMHANLPLVAFTGFFRFDDGELALEPFIVSCFLTIYHQNLYPVHWWVIVTTLLLHLLLIIFSWLPFVMTQNMIHFQSTVILSLFYVAMLICNYRIHHAKVVEFLFTESFSMNLSSKTSSSQLSPLSDIDEKRIISDYLDEMNEDSIPSIISEEGVISSSDSLIEASNLISNIPMSRIHHRRQHQHHGRVDTSIQPVEANMTTSILSEGQTTSSPEQRKPHRLLAKERPLY